MCVKFIIHIVFTSTVLIKQLNKDKYITVEEASKLTNTKLFATPVPIGAATIPASTACNTTGTNTWNMKSNSSIIIINNSSDVSQNGTTSQYTHTLASRLVMETSNPVIGVAGTTDTSHTSGSVANGAFALDQHGEFQHTSEVESLPPVIMELPDIVESTNAVLVTSSDVQSTMQSLQSTNAIDMTENLINHHISSEGENEHTLMPSISNTEGIN